MRRMWAAGVATMMCIALASSSVLAQGDHVTGTANTTTDPISFDLSDPRVSGQGSGNWIADLGSIFWGEWTINGPEGDWVGPWIGQWNEGLGKYLLVFSLEGTDTYEGWAFVGTYLDAGGDPQASVEGRVYLGDAPRMEWAATEPDGSPAE